VYRVGNRDFLYAIVSHCPINQVDVGGEGASIYASLYFCPLYSNVSPSITLCADKDMEKNNTIQINFYINYNN